MTDLTLYITWKNYSSWSLRAWLLMRALEIPFEEVLVPMTDAATLPGMAGISPTRKVPCLIDRGDRRRHHLGDHGDCRISG